MVNMQTLERHVLLRSAKRKGCGVRFVAEIGCCSVLHCRELGRLELWREILANSFTGRERLDVRLFSHFYHSLLLQ